MQEGRDDERRDYPDRDIDEETPVPAVVVRYPAAERGAERRGDDDAEDEDRLDEALLIAGEDLADRAGRSLQGTRR